MKDFYNTNGMGPLNNTISNVYCYTFILWWVGRGQRTAQCLIGGLDEMLPTVKTVEEV